MKRCSATFAREVTSHTKGERYSVGAFAHAEIKSGTRRVGTDASSWESVSTHPCLRACARVRLRVLSKTMREEQRSGKIMRSPSEVGYAAVVKMKMGRKLKDGETWRTGERKSGRGLRGWGRRIWGDDCMRGCILNFAMRHVCLRAALCQSADLIFTVSGISIRNYL